MKRSSIKKRPLSDTTLAGLEPEDREYREADGGGLYFRVKPNGTKDWQLRYKRPTGQWSWAGLGGYPEVSGQLARKKALDLLAAAAEGEDISAVTRQQRMETSSGSFEALAREWLATMLPTWDAKTCIRNKGMLENHVFPVMGRRPYTDIYAQDWLALMKSIQQQKGLIDQAGRIRSLCKRAYDYAKVLGRIQYNPLDGIEKYLDHAPVRNMPHVEEKELPDLLRAIASYPNVPVRIGLQLMSLLFCRPSELRLARWSEFDLKHRLWNIPPERTKKRREHLIPLPDQAVALLEQLHQYSGHADYLFLGRDRDKPLSDMAFTQALRRLGYENRQTPHGFRHIASTLLNNRGFDERHIEIALAHVKGGVAGVYNKAQYLDDRRQMLQWYADHLDELTRA